MDAPAPLKRLMLTPWGGGRAQARRRGTSDEFIIGPNRGFGLTSGELLTISKPNRGTSDEFIIGPNRGFGLTSGELLTISKPNPRPKSEKPLARKWLSKPNL